MDKKKSAETENSIIAENFANWALDVATALPKNSNEIIARMTYDAVGLMYAARREDYILSVMNSVIDKGSCRAVGHKAQLGSFDSCLVNGTAIHGEDLMILRGTPVHLAASLVPPMTALSKTSNALDDWVRSISLAAELVVDW